MTIDGGLKSWGVDSQVKSRDTKWTSETTRAVKTEYSDGKITFYVAGPYGSKTISERDFESSKARQQELITLDLSRSTNAEQLTKILDSAEKNVFEFNDETTRGECFEKEYFRAYVIKNNGDNFQVVVQINALAWTRWDISEGRALIGKTEGAYFPDGLSDYVFGYYLLISQNGELLDIDSKGADEKSWLFLDDPRIDANTIEELWNYAGFAHSEEDERVEEAIALFVNSAELSPRHKSIRERLEPLLK